MRTILSLLGFRVWAYTGLCTMLQRGNLRVNIYSNRVRWYRAS